MKIEEVLSSALYEEEPSQTPAGGRSWYSYIPGTTDWFRELPGALGMGQSNVTGEPGKIFDPQGHYRGQDGQIHQQPWAARPENWPAGGGMGHLPPPTRPVWNTTDNKPPLGQYSYPDQTETRDPDGTQHWRDNWIAPNGQMAGMHIVVPPNYFSDENYNNHLGPAFPYHTDRSAPWYPAWYAANKDILNSDGTKKYDYLAPPLKTPIQLTPQERGGTLGPDLISVDQRWGDPRERQDDPASPGTSNYQPTTKGFDKAAVSRGIDSLDPAARSKFYADLPGMSLDQKLWWKDDLTGLGNKTTAATTQPGQVQPGQTSQPYSGMRPGGTAQGYQLQQQLNARGANLATDGIIGPQTRAATRNFQGQNGLNADGIAGPRTQAAFQQNRPVPNQSPTMQSPTRPASQPAPYQRPTVPSNQLPNTPPMQQPGAAPPRPVQPPTQAAAQVARPPTPPPTPLPQVPHYAMNSPGAPQSSPAAAPTAAPLAPGSSNMATGGAATPKPVSPTPQPQPQSTTEAYKRLPKMTCADYFALFEAEINK